MGNEQKPTKLHFDRSVPKQIFEHLRDDIVSMDIKPGELISETRLAEKFGVSRTPVREALFKLSNMGFVEVRPQRGTFVSHLSMPKILEARFVREAIEVAIVVKLAGSEDNGLIETCESVIEEQEQAAKKDQAMKFQALDDQFHQTLAKHTGFPKICQLIEAEKAHMDRVRGLSLVEIKGQYEVILQQHKLILNSIKDGDPAKARLAMETHMQEVFAILKLAPVNHPEYFSEN